MSVLDDKRFEGLTPFPEKAWLATPTMHGGELKYMTEAYDTNWMSTVGENLNQAEALLSEFIGRKYAIALASGTAALHMAIRAAGIRLYGKPKVFQGVLQGRKVFCSDMTFAATLNAVAYEGGEAVFIDTEYGTWNMSPEALARAFEIYPDVKMVVLAHLYGTPSKMEEIRKICDAHGALIIEDAAESLGATYRGTQTGTFGDISAISFNGNKIITGSSGGMLLTDDEETADMVRKWSTQAREPAPWYQHEDLGYNYRMSNVIAGVIRGQFPHMAEHIAQKKALYERYKEGLKGLPVSMNPYAEDTEPNFWLSCLIIDPEAMCKTERGPLTATYETEPGKSCPTEILEVLAALNAEGRPIWKPMHCQPMYEGFGFVAAKEGEDNGSDIFARGLCLPSDNKMTKEAQDVIIEAIRRCFD